MFDGLVDVVGGNTGGSMFPTYDPIVFSRVNTSSPLLMTAFYALAGLNGSLNVQFEVTDNITSTNNQVSFVIVEDDAHDQVNLARLMLDNEPFDLTIPGQNDDIVKNFDLEAEWNLENLKVIVYVQSHDTKEVLQTCYAEPDYTATIVIDPNPNGLNAPWLISGPNDYSYAGAGDRTLPVWYEGQYSLTWLPVFGWDTPNPNPTSQVVLQDDTITFTGNYSGGPFSEITAGPLGHDGAGRGVAMLDVDADEDLDIHVINENQADLLLRNDGSGNFVDIASGSLADTGAGQAAIWADYDNDGDLDIYLTRYNQANQLLQNDGSGSFTDVADFGLENTGPGCGATWADYDNDGLVDLYFVNYGAENQLFKNYGDMGGGFWLWLSVGGIITDNGPGTCAVWGDYDNDGYSDIYLTNRYGSNKLFQNYGPLGFFDATGSGILDDLGNGSGVAWSDYDNDGDLDLYMANDGSADRLFRNGGGYFSLVIGDDLSDPGHGRGVVWGDFDNDADLDLYVSRYGEADLYLQNLGSDTFRRVLLGWSGVEGNGCGAACGDYDGDGDLDVYVANDGQPNVLLENEADGTHHWLDVRLAGTTANRSAIGAQVRVFTSGLSQLRTITGGSGYYSQNPLRVHFGLGAATLVDSVVVTWPGGVVETIPQLVVDQHLFIQQSEETAVTERDLLPSVCQLHSCYPNPFNPSTTIRFSLPDTRPVRLAVYSLDGRQVATLVSETRPAGNHAVVWHGKDDAGRPVASGTFIARIEAGDYQAAQRMMLVK